MTEKKMMKKTKETPREMSVAGYDHVLSDVVALLESARRASSRAVNAVMTAVYWEIGRRIVEFEQGGERRAGYGKTLLTFLSRDLTERFGRGFGYVNLTQMRNFYLLWPRAGILQTPSEIFETPVHLDASPILQTVSEELDEATSQIRQIASAELEDITDKVIIQTVSGQLEIDAIQIRQTPSGNSADACSKVRKLRDTVA